MRGRWTARTAATGGAALFLALAACAAATAQAATPASGSGWGTAREAPGTAALNRGASGLSGFSSVSCASAGNCAAGGTYTDSGGNIWVFLASQKNGVWGKAEQVPGIAALNLGGYPVDSENGPAGPSITQVSCSSAGNCAIVGTYRNAAHFVRPFVISEHDGVWGTAREIAGIEQFSPKRGVDSADSVSCSAAGECAAVGSVGGAKQTPLAFVVSEHHGTWGKAQAIKGFAASSTPEPESVSCTAPGDCLAGGAWFGAPPSDQTTAFLATERNGRWSSAQPVRGLAALDTGHGSTIKSLTCVSAGNCVVTGRFHDKAGFQVYVASERNGVWGKAQAMPGLAALNRGGSAFATQVSCASAGNCATGGFYVPGSNLQREQAWVASEHNGRWAKAQEVLGSALNSGMYAMVDSVSCGASGNCAAGGFYTPAADPSQYRRAFVISQRNGVWGRMQPVPGMAALDRGHYSELTSLACSRSGKCSAVGYYEDIHRSSQMFVVGRS